MPRPARPRARAPHAAAAWQQHHGRFAALAGLVGDELERSDGCDTEPLDWALGSPPPACDSAGAPECRCWADVPAALLRAVCAVAALSGADALAMRAVCRNWRAALPGERDCWTRIVHCAAMAGPWAADTVCVPYEALTQHRVLIRHLLSAAWLPDADAVAAAGGSHGTKRFRREICRTSAANAAGSDGRASPAGDALPALARVHTASTAAPHVAFALIAPPGSASAGAWCEVLYLVSEYSQTSINPPAARLTGPGGAMPHAVLHPNIGTAGGEIDLDVLTPGMGYTPALQMRTLTLSVGALLGSPTPGCSDGKPGFDGAPSALLARDAKAYRTAAARLAASNGVFGLGDALRRAPPQFGGGAARWPSLLEVGCKALSLLLGPAPACALPPHHGGPDAPLGAEACREAARRAALVHVLACARRVASLATPPAQRPPAPPEPSPLEAAVTAQLAAGGVRGPPPPPPPPGGMGSGVLYRRWPDGAAASCAADATQPLHAQERAWAAAAGYSRAAADGTPLPDGCTSEHDPSGGEDSLPLGVLPMRRLAVRELCRYAAAAGDASRAGVDLELALLLDASARAGRVCGAERLAEAALEAAHAAGAPSLCHYLGLLREGE